MKREFRYYDTAFDEMETRQIVVLNQMIKDLNSSIALKDQTIFYMQYTGLKDSDGKEVYEGDVVEIKNKPYKSECPVIVTWGEKTHGFNLKFEFKDNYGRNRVKYYALPLSKNIKVIGNIFENKSW